MLPMLNGIRHRYRGVFAKRLAPVHQAAIAALRACADRRLLGDETPVFDANGEVTNWRALFDASGYFTGALTRYTVETPAIAWVNELRVLDSTALRYSDVRRLYSLKRVAECLAHEISWTYAKGKESYVASNLEATRTIISHITREELPHFLTYNGDYAEAVRLAVITHLGEG
jgi:hypothetical protein